MQSLTNELVRAPVYNYMEDIPACAVQQQIQRDPNIEVDIQLHDTLLPYSVITEEVCDR